MKNRLINDEIKVVEIVQDVCNPIKVDARFNSVVLTQGEDFIVVEPASVLTLINELRKVLKTENKR